MGVFENASSIPIYSFSIKIEYFPKKAHLNC